MNTQMDRTYAISMAREALDLLQEGSLACADLCNIIEDSMMDHQISWTALGISEEEYRRRIDAVSVRAAKELYGRIVTSTIKEPWIEKFEMVMRRFDLDWKDVGIRRTDFLIQKRWHAAKKRA